MCHNSHIKKLSCSMNKRADDLTVSVWRRMRCQCDWQLLWSEPRETRVSRFPWCSSSRRLCTDANACPHYRPEMTQVWGIQDRKNQLSIKSVNHSICAAGSVALIREIVCKMCLVVCYTLNRTVCCSSGLGVSGVICFVYYTFKKCKDIEISGHFKMMFSSPEKCIEMSITLHNK